MANREISRRTFGAPHEAHGGALAETGTSASNRDPHDRHVYS